VHELALAEIVALLLGQIGKFVLAQWLTKHPVDPVVVAVLIDVLSCAEVVRSDEKWEGECDTDPQTGEERVPAQGAQQVTLAEVQDG